MADKNEAPSTPLGAPNADAALKELLKAETVSATPSAFNPRGSETYTFSIDMTDGAGVRRTGEFTNKILTIEQRMTVSLLIAKLSRNTPWEAIDDEGRNLLEMVAHLTISLAAKPSWFALDTLTNIRLLNAVFAEVAGHEAFFRGSPAPQSDS